ncbi:MAG: SDR family oxidoreductase [Candidatus Pacebacteria bacterium]|nr:SDR family oxidoreductase [Candidatus Paceibacterota bacterium]
MDDKKTILITGGAGYVGSKLVEALLERGYNIRILDKGYFGFDSLPKGVEVLRGDCRRPFEGLMQGVWAVIHLAAFSNDPTADYDPEANWQINFEGTKALADLAKRSGVKRFIYASTCSTYYQTGKLLQEIFDENSELVCEAPYPKSKLAAEKYLFLIANEDFQPTILRKGTIYGKSPRMRYDLILNTFVKDAFLKGEIKVHAEGKLSRPMLSLTEAVDVYCQMIEAPLEEIGKQIINVPGANYQIMEVAFEVYQTLLEKRGVRIKLDIWRHNEGVIRSYQASDVKLKDILPNRKKQSLSEAVLEIWDDIVRKYDPNDPIYYNIRNLEELKRYEQRLKDLGGVL